MTLVMSGINAAGKPRAPSARVSSRVSSGLVLLAALACGPWFALPLHAADQPPAPVSLTALAEELPLEQLGLIPIESVSTASRFTQKVNEAPASVSVLTAEEIRRYGYRTLADMLRSVRGLYVTYDRSYSYLGVRGFSRPGDFNSRVLVMVDGHRVNDNIFEGAYIGREFILDVDLIDRVEIVRGPSSSLYGGSAFLGVVNIISKRAAAVRKVEVSVDAGSLDSYKGRVSYGGVFPGAGVEVLLSGSYFDSQGHGRLYYPEFDSSDTNSGVAVDLDHERSGNLFGSLSWRELTLTAAFVSREKSIPTAAWEVAFNDPRYEAVDTHGYADLKLRHAFDEKTELVARMYYDDVRYSADYPNYPATGPEDVGLNRDHTQGRLLGGEALLTRRWKMHTVTAGGELRWHLQQDIDNYDVAPRVVIADVSQESYDAGFYAQDEVAIRPDLLLSVGARYDYYDSFGGTTNPRLGLIWKPWEGGALKILYGKAFRAPNAYELYYPLGDLPTNTDLNPERMQTYEAVYEQSLPYNLRLSLAGYYYHIDDLISVNPDTLLFENVAQVDTRGVETELEWRHAGGMQARASYTFQRAEDAATGELLSNSPEHLAKLNLRVPLVRERLFAGLEVQYTGQAKTLPERATPSAAAFTVANLAVSVENLIKGVEITAGIYNLFNARYAYPGGPGHTQDLIFQDGRSLNIKLTSRF